MPEENDVFEQDLTDLSKKEIAAFRAFERSYREIYPAPVQPDITRVMQKDWKFVTSIITAVAGTALAAFRTGGAFYVAAVYDLSPLLSRVEAIVAVTAIEGCLVLFSVRNAYEKKDTNENVVLALWLTGIISVLAGFDQSVNLLSEEGAFAFVIRWLLVVAMGLGATVIAWLSGHTLGAQLVRFENDRKSSQKEYELSLKGYRANMLKNWKASYELTAVNERKNRSFRSPSTNRSPERSDEPVRSPDRSRANNTNGASKDDIYQKLDTVLQTQNRIAGVSEIAREIAMDRSKALGEDPVSDADFHRYKGSVSETRKRWLVDKGLTDEQGNPTEKGA